MRNSKKRWLARAGSCSVALLALAACGTDRNSSPNAVAPHAVNAPALSPQQLEAQLLNHILLHNQIEMRLADMAMERSQAKEVRDFATLIRRDHEESNQRLTALAQRLNVTLRNIDLGEGAGAGSAQPGSTPQPGTTAPATPGAGSQPATTPGSTAQPSPAPGNAGSTSQPISVPESEADIRARAEFRALSEKLRDLRGVEFDKLFVQHMIAEHQKDIAMLTASRQQLQTNSEVVGFIDSLIPVLQRHLQLAQQLQGSEAPTGTSAGKGQQNQQKQGVTPAPPTGKQTGTTQGAPQTPAVKTPVTPTPVQGKTPVTTPAVQPKQPAQPVVQPKQPAQPAQPVVQPKQPVQPVAPPQPLAPQKPVQPVKPGQGGSAGSR